VRSKLLRSGWQGIAAAYALIIVVISLLPEKVLEAWVPLARESPLDSGLREDLVQIVAVAGAGLAVAPLLLRALRLRIRVAPRLWLSRSLSISLVLYLACLALLASASLRAAAWKLADDLLPGWLHLAVKQLDAGHVMAYVGLGLLLVLAWGRRIEPWLLGAGALAASGVLELLQDFVPGRASDWWDLLANGLGISIGLMAGRLWIAAAREAPRGAGSQRRQRSRRRTTSSEFRTSGRGRDRARQLRSRPVTRA
jgi:hypothetical protein